MHSQVEIGTVEISRSAAQAIRFNFNPSNLDEVARIKTLTGALITRLEGIASHNPAALRLAEAAIENVITASMWSVLAATAPRTEHPA